MIVLQTLYVLLVITEDIVLVLRVTQEIHIKEDVQRYLKSYLMLDVRKIENVKASMLVSLKMVTAHVEIHVLSTSHALEMHVVRSTTSCHFVL